MRVAIVAESFLPHVNGVTNTVLKAVDYLTARGHTVLIIAPGENETTSYKGVPVVRVPQFFLPKVNSLPLGLPVPRLYKVVRDFRPDVVHLASPFLLGLGGVLAANRLRVPTVAVYQTDVAGFATEYGLAWTTRAAWAWTRELHNRCSRTLVPSSQAARALRTHGVQRIHRWGRGVDPVFSPTRRDPALRARFRADTHTVVGFVGRLAVEKNIWRLRHAGPGTQVVIVGDGPEREALQTQLPDAIFTGALHGEDLARAYASFDVFVHTGEHETFCQTIQEAQASGLPVVAPRAGGPVDLVGSGGVLVSVDKFCEHLPAAIAQARALPPNTTVPTWDTVCTDLFEHYLAVVA